MAWTLFGFDFDLYTLLLPVGKAIGGAMCGFLFKKVIGCFMDGQTKKCKIEGCKGFCSGATRGLCQICYKKAKQMVENGETWERLASLGLCDLLESDKSKTAFDAAYKKAIRGDDF